MVRTLLAVFLIAVSQRVATRCRAPAKTSSAAAKKSRALLNAIGSNQRRVTVSVMAVVTRCASFKIQPASRPGIHRG